MGNLRQQSFSLKKVDFYGRTGYAPESGTYTWNEAGLLNSDSARGILSTTYNHLGLPITQTNPGPNSTTTSALRYIYSADGALLRITREAKIGSSNSFRDYAGSRIFENGSLEYSYFPGGYFDSAGAAHYCHTDYQGSIIAVTDSLGTVVQTTGYYPYGEPWREPSGQPMLFAGKERTPQADYLFGPRRQIPALGLWDAPDIFAGISRNISPYSYCAGNPILYIDPSGLKIEQNSQARWAHLKANIMNQKQKLENEIKKAESNSSSANKKAEKIGEKKGRVALLGQTLANMDLIEASNQVYSLNRQYDTSGGLDYDNETDIISITYSNTAGFVHEVTHAAQFEAGDLGFTIDGATIGQDVFDEIAAYSAQYAFSPSIVSNIKSSIGVKRISDITVEWVQNITINGNKPYEMGGSNHTGISPLNVFSGYDEIIKAYPYLINSIGKNTTLKDYMYKYKSL